MRPAANSTTPSNTGPRTGRDAAPTRGSPSSSRPLLPQHHTRPARATHPWPQPQATASRSGTIIEAVPPDPDTGDARGADGCAGAPEDLTQPVSPMTTAHPAARTKRLTTGALDARSRKMFLLEATTEDLSPEINEYLPVCMKKYGDAAPDGKVPPEGK